MITKELIEERLKMFEDCKYCNIHRVQRYIVNNIKNYDIKSKCGQCIAGFSLLIVDGLYREPPSTIMIKDLEDAFYNYRDNKNEKM